MLCGLFRNSEVGSSDSGNSSRYDKGRLSRPAVSPLGILFDIIVTPSGSIASVG